MEKIIDAIIIDTSVIKKYQFDFLGLTSKLIPSFYDLLTEKNIKILNHFVLDNEIKKHICTSEIIKRVEGLVQTFKRNKDYFKLIGISGDESIDKLNALDLKSKMTNEYINRYSNSIWLPFTEPQEIFEAYFNDIPPFNSQKDKKSEFPDAFIINAVKKYSSDNKTKNILVISDDADWQSAFETVERISVLGSIDEAIKTIQTADRIIPIIYDNEEVILAEVSLLANWEEYDIPEYDIANGVDINKIVAERIYDVVPLKISAESVLFKCSVDLKVSGKARVLDENKSYYDKEDGVFYFAFYSDLEFENALARIQCEINMGVLIDDEKIEVTIDDTRIISKYDIDLDLEDAIIEVTELSEDDIALEALREDKGYK